MTVRSEPVVSTGYPKRMRNSVWPVGLALLAFGIPSWLAGGKYTLGGWIVWLNWLFHWLELPVTIPSVTGWWVVLIIPVAFIYSRIEICHLPAYRRQGEWHYAHWTTWIAWALLVATDVGSTFQGMYTPQPGAWMVVQQVSSDVWLSAICAAILTFAPDRIILGGYRLLRS